MQAFAPVLRDEGESAGVEAQVVALAALWQTVPVETESGGRDRVVGGDEEGGTGAVQPFELPQAQRQGELGAGEVLEEEARLHLPGEFHHPQGRKDRRPPERAAFPIREFPAKDSVAVEEHAATFLAGFEAR